MKETERIGQSAPRRYPVRDGKKPSPPNFDRVVSRLSDGEIEEELRRAARDPEALEDFARALNAEKRRRSRSR